jgi:hypothetical protein
MDFAANQGPRIIAATSALTALATVFLVLRVYCKLYNARRLWWDDYALGLSWVSARFRVIMILCWKYD